MAEEKKNNKAMVKTESGTDVKKGGKGYALKKGEAAAYTAHNLQISMMPNIDLNDPQAVQIRTTDYFSLCVQNDMRPSVEGYSLSLGITRQTLYSLRTGRKKCPNEVRTILEKVQALLTAQMVDYMQSGKINPIAGIFLMKNNMAYTNDDKGSQELETGTNIEADVQEIAKKYGVLPE